MRVNRYRPTLSEGIVLAAAILVAIYAFWVIRNVGASPPDGSATAAPGKTIASTTTSPIPTPAPTAPPSLRSFRESVAAAGSILVVGDSTGDEPGEWVDRWAQDLGTSHEVGLHLWNSQTKTFSDPPLVYGSGPRVDVWNLSYPGVLDDYPQHFGQVGMKPGAVILNIGHDRDRVSLRRGIRLSAAAIRKRWGPVASAWMLQNPTVADAAQQERAVAFLRSTATRDRVPVIDVHAAFRRAGPVGALLMDGTRPNSEGSRVWADAVEAALAAKPAN